MYTYMPRPLIKCSKCGSTDIVIPERPANGLVADVGTLLRCKGCGHEKREQPKSMTIFSMGGAIGATWPTEETF